MHDEQGNLAAEKILVRTDSAGASREFLHHLHALGLQFSTSFACRCPTNASSTGSTTRSIGNRPWTSTGTSARRWVIDATKVIELKDYPEGTRLYLRAEPLHPGAKASLFDVDGHRSRRS